MAGDAGLQVEALDASDMAVGTNDGHTLEVHSVAFQAEPACFSGVLKDKSLPTRWYPGFGCMAVCAIYAEQTQVGLWFGVTFMALEWCGFKRPGERCGNR